MPTIDLTVERDRHVTGGLRIVTGLYMGPASYASGGDSWTPGDVGLGDIEFVQFAPARDTTPVLRGLGFDYTNNKVLWFLPDGTQVTALTNLSTFSARFMAYGK